MDMNDYQKRAHETAIYPAMTVSKIVDGHEVAMDLPIYPVMGLAGEAGEVCEKFKKILRDETVPDWDKLRLALRKELGDVLWYVAEIATKLDMTLDDVARINLEKLSGRQQRGALHGSGDDR